MSRSPLRRALATRSLAVSTPEFGAPPSSDDDSPHRTRSVPPARAARFRAILGVLVLSGCFSPTGIATDTAATSPGTDPTATTSPTGTTGPTTGPTTTAETSTETTSTATTAPTSTTETSPPDQGVPALPCEHVELSSLDEGKGGLVIHAAPSPQPHATGIRVGGIGDFNGDGLDDVRVVALPSTQPYCLSTHVWQNWFVYGTTHTDPVDLAISLDAPFFTEKRGLHVDGNTCQVPPCTSQFGAAFARLGDIDGDGRADVAFGAPVTADRGRVYVFHGRAGANVLSPLVLDMNSLDYVIEGAPGQYIGRALAGLGDIDGDARPDLGFHTGLLNQAWPRDLYIRYSHPYPPVNPWPLSSFTSPEDGFWIIDPVTEPPPWDFGNNLRGGHDFNADGIPDLLVNTEPGDMARVVVVFNEAGRTQNSIGLEFFTGASMRATRIRCTVTCGQSANFIGDFNGDGIADLAAGEYDVDPNNPQIDRVAVVFGAPGARTIDVDGLDGTEGLLIHGEGTTDLFGAALAGVDLNGDGISDLVIGAPNYDAQRGRVYVIFGRQGITSVDLADILAGHGGFVIDAPPGTVDALGLSVDNAGNFNGDAYEDLVIGAPALNLGTCMPISLTPGKAYVLHGGHCTR